MKLPETGNVLIVWDRLGDYHRARIRELEQLLGPERVYSADFGGQDALYGWENSSGKERHFLLSNRPVDKMDLLRVSRFARLLRTKRVTHVAIA